MISVMDKLVNDERHTIDRAVNVFYRIESNQNHYYYRLNVNFMHATAVDSVDVRLLFFFFDNFFLFGCL